MSNHYDPSKTELYRRSTAVMGSTEGITQHRRTCSSCGLPKSRVKRVGGGGKHPGPHLSTNIRPTVGDSTLNKLNRDVENL